MAVLEVKDLHVHYGVIEALKGVNVTVEEGKIVTLIGSNGAGKTSLLHALSGIVKKSKGDVYFEKKPITKSNPRHIVQNGLIQVPEGRHVFPGLSVLENLMMGAYLRKDKKEVQKDLQKVFKRFPILETRKYQDASTLSGGEQQLLAMGRALMARPKVLLLDEPSMGLAPILVKEIFSIIKEINEEGTTVLLVEQNARMALQIADYAYVLETGSIRLEGPASELISSSAIQEAYLGGSKEK